MHGERLGDAGRASESPHAHTIAVTISRRLAIAAEEDIRARYDLGRALRAVRDGEPAAVQALEAVADALGVHWTLLRRYVRVATVIPPAQLEAFVALRSQRGMPMTWSHLEHLAEIRSARMRAVFAARIAAEGWSVRALKANVRESKGKHGSAQGTHQTNDSAERTSPSVLVPNIAPLDGRRGAA